MHVVVRSLTDVPAVLAVRHGARRTHEGFQVADEPWDLASLDLVCHGEVRDEATAAAALLCAARGADLVVALRDPEESADFIEDLRHLGSVEHSTAPTTGGQGSRLAEDQITLLRLLASGLSLTDAAQRLFLSQRTAERRVAAARRTLGVATTAEALARLEMTDDSTMGGNR
jgi:DNA-binding CsgD family transcriptional regulator